MPLPDSKKCSLSDSPRISARFLTGMFEPAVAQLCYNVLVREALFTDTAVRQFKRLPRAVKPTIKDAIALHLIQGDPTETTRNKFRLRRPSEFADYELRVGDWRVFYRVYRHQVIVALIGEKRGMLVVEGEELSI
jgi:mRNA-degrading endonuclease RelE of RelBE toxin-antitoxin system